MISPAKVNAILIVLSGSQTRPTVTGSPAPLALPPEGKQRHLSAGGRLAGGKRHTQGGRAPAMCQQLYPAQSLEPCKEARTTVYHALYLDGVTGSERSQRLMETVSRDPSGDKCSPECRRDQSAFCRNTIFILKEKLALLKCRPFSETSGISSNCNAVVLSHFYDEETEAPAAGREQRGTRSI